ncbi:MAG: phosphotransferase [Kiritimatiellia bacterium]|nr:phosphotransferase [Kiritimatiellia bacterium]
MSRRSRLSPNRAIVLAAGLGTRMRDFGRDLPKPLMPLWNRPILRRTLETLAAWGVEHALVNLHAGADALLREFRDSPPPGLKIDFSFEPTVLGTGGALRRAAWFLDTEPFWILNADIAFELNPAPFRNALRDPNTLAALWMHSTRGPRTVELRDGQVVNFRSDRSGSAGTFTFCGLHLARPEILRWIPKEERFFSIVDAYERARAEGRRISGVCVPEVYWADLGTPERLRTAHEETWRAAKNGRPGGAIAARALSEIRKGRQAGVHIRGWAAIDPAARLEPGARIENSILCAGAEIGPKANVLNALVGRDARVRGTARGGALVWSRIATPEERQAAEAAGLRTSRTTALGFDARGSSREFIRLDDGRRSVLLIRYGPDRAENARYAGQTRLLARCGIPVPRILHEDRVRRFLLMEDLGDRTLQTDWPRLSEPARFRAYARVIREVARFHRAADEFLRLGGELEAPFGPEVYLYERDLFLHRFVRDFCGGAAGETAIRSELERVSKRLDTEPLVLVHRDLQSSNLIPDRRGPVFIDFQGMRLGPAVYDWAALLYDPYLPMTPALRGRLLREAKTVGGCRSESLPAAAVQRLIQALGAYARLSAGAGGARFTAAIPRALANLEAVLRRIDPPCPQLRAFVRRQRSRPGRDRTDGRRI